ncbi:MULTISPECIES: lytic transglycosylase [Shewanella]|uniref:Membrane-bound lytic murein transglycosylase D n=1 Tax=Shewanella fodinae TaxID=552357 RepID=A0A4R2FI86_9GAMM|nr:MULTISPECIES: LysM peptidoglycan-binding domain-containing protein [Shewanella]MBO1270212.1 LysM peptidoglycan-binding domain-containing protein [Shewanella sp. 4t3-1-2LB]MCL2905639.1 LysM peptidoglycan-binding domain-containing protein [Shewanella fodinae]MDN5370845.1 rane-bound lytic murein transglycosylase [Shewanella sp.]TCN81890.1 membrane-bound lytic murein transglycosylase D [Shewanella fodinae]
MKQRNLFTTAGIVVFLAGCQTVPLQSSQTAPPKPPANAAEVLQKAPQEPQQPQLAVTDVWQRLRNQLNIPVPDNKLVQQYRDWYTHNPKHLQQISERAAPFLYLIVDQIEQRHLPMELALLPIVESAFDPYAYSPGAASGLWQFTSPMARHFGLKINWWYDGRRDVPAATQAALDMMQYLYRKTGNNWLYAIAAYNTGEGRVLNAVRRNASQGKPTDFWSLSLPKETERYVPQLLALADVIKHADKYGVQLTPIDNQPAVEVVDTGSQIDLALAAKLAGMDISELQQLNPGYNRWATAPKGPFKLVLPVDKAQDFEVALATTDPSDRLNWLRYEIQPGDSLGLIAKEHQTTVDIIRAVNDIKGNNIVAGKHLLIPVSLQDASAYPLSADNRLQNKQLKSKYKTTYAVRHGDSLWKIARANNLSVSEIASWNGMSVKDALHPGKVLVLWHNRSSDESAITRTVKYKVRNGDSLARIADKFNVTVSQLQEWNQLQRQKYLQPGQVLTLFVDVTASGS